jgi:hypothetical protein
MFVSPLLFLDAARRQNYFNNLILSQPLHLSRRSATKADQPSTFCLLAATSTAMPGNASNDTARRLNGRL